MEVVVRRVRSDEGPLLRSVRLSALADSPSAFGSSYADEADQTDERWTERARRDAAGERSITFFATLDGSAVGLVSGYRADPAGAAVELVSMWVPPADRRSGIAVQLVTAVAGWARQIGMPAVELWVTRGNDAAARLYESVGFRSTGDHQPLPSDPCKDERRMRLRLD